MTNVIECKSQFLNIQNVRKVNSGKNKVITCLTKFRRVKITDDLLIELSVVDYRLQVSARSVGWQTDDK